MNLYFWLRTGKGDFFDWAVDLGNELMPRAREDEKGPFGESDGVVRVGLGYGQSGVVLFLLRLSQITGDRRSRDVGRQALNYNLRWGREVERGIVSYPGTPSDSTLEPYLEEGTAGIVKVLLRYGIVGEAELLSPDLWRKYSISASYLFGLGSLVDALVDLHLFTGADQYMSLAERPLADINDLYLLEIKNGLTTPGDRGLVISCDWGDGVAGVMRVLHRYLMKNESDFMLDELDRGRRK